MSTLLQKVNEAYMNALQNQYNVDAQSPEVIAVDMKMYDADLENEDLIQITECVKSIQQRRMLKG